MVNFGKYLVGILVAKVVVCVVKHTKKIQIVLLRVQKTYIGDKYDYSKVKYVNSYTKVCIICKEHGEFWQTPGSHLNGSGCKKCSIKLNSNKRKSNDFIERAKDIHMDKYDYSKVEYINCDTKVCIICPIHR